MIITFLGVILMLIEAVVNNLTGYEYDLTWLRKIGVALIGLGTVIMFGTFLII